MTSNNPFEGTDVPDDGIDHLRGLLDWIELIPKIAKP